jgi:hypothetical protein
MKIAINEYIIDRASSAVIGQYNNAFKNVDINAEELARSVKKGYAFCAQHKNGWREGSNFTEAGFLAVDIDDGLTVQNALNDEFVQTYASILYTTIRHTDEFQRFRIIFELDKAITDAAILRDAVTGLIQRFGGDTACGDVCHMFYGSSTSTPLVIGKILPVDQIDELVVRAKESRTAVASMAWDKKRSNTRSILVLPKDTMVKMESGKSIKLADGHVGVRIFCPRHVDNKASAVTLRSQQGNPGLYCSKCVTTYFLDTGFIGFQKANQYDFDYSWDRILKLTADEYIANETENGVPSLNMIRGGNISPVSERYLPYFDPDVSKGGRFLIDEEFDPAEPAIPNPDAGILKVPFHITFVKSPKGTGKTEWLGKVVQDFKAKKAKILLIGHRRSLITASAKRLGLTSYLIDANDTHVSAKYNPATNLYAVCVDSLTTRLDTELHQYDLILIDEAEQVFSHLLAETMKENRREILHTLKYFVGKAKAIYMLDADLGRTSIEIIDALLDKQGKYQAIVNTWTPENKTVKIYKNKNHLVGELLSCLRRGERCFVCANSKTRIDSLHSEIGEQFGSSKRLLVVTSDNAHEPEIQRIIQNIKTTAQEYDAIFVSPAIGTGIDITFENDNQLIDKVFGIFEARINTHFDIDQQLARVRNPKQTLVYISPEEFSFETDANAIRAELIASDAAHRRFVSINPDGTKNYNQDVLYETIFASVTAMERASKNRLLKNFRDLKRHNGWTVEDIENDPALAREGKKVGDAGKARLSNENAEGILGAEKIGPNIYSEYKQKSNTGKITKAEKFSMRHYELEAFYYEDVTPALIQSHNNGKFRDCVRMYELLNFSDENLRSRDMRDEEKLAGDRQNSAQKQKLLISLFRSSGLMNENNQFDLGKEIELIDLAIFIEECVSKKKEIDFHLDIAIRKDLKTNPTQQLGVFLKLVGMSLVKTKSIVTEEGGKRYSYGLDGDKLAKVQALVNRRADDQVRENWKQSLQDRDTYESSPEYKRSQSGFYI